MQGKSLLDYAFHNLSEWRNLVFALFSFPHQINSVSVIVQGRNSMQILFIENNFGVPYCSNNRRQLCRKAEVSAISLYFHAAIGTMVSGLAEHFLDRSRAPQHPSSVAIMVPLAKKKIFRRPLTAKLESFEQSCHTRTPDGLIAGHEPNSPVCPSRA